MGTTDHDGEPQESGTWFGNFSRRTFIQRGTLTAAAVGVVGSVPGLSGLLAGGASEAPAAEADATEFEAGGGTLTEPLVAHVKDLSTGEISLFQGERQVLIRDPALASRLFSAVRP
jgi:hypothetical protein